MAIKTYRKVAFFLILSKNTIRQPANILIAFDFFLIVIQISIGQNKICSIENYCCPVNFQTAQESSPKPFRIGLRGFFFKKQAP